MNSPFKSPGEVRAPYKQVTIYGNQLRRTQGTRLPLPAHYVKVCRQVRIGLAPAVRPMMLSSEADA